VLKIKGKFYNDRTESRSTSAGTLGRRSSLAAGAVGAVGSRAGRLPAARERLRPRALHGVGPAAVAYCQAVSQHDRAAQALRREGDVVNGKPSPWITVQEKAVRAMTALSMRLRLSPQARREKAQLPRPLDWWEQRQQRRSDDDG
jgi:hypothetical protein